MLLTGNVLVRQATGADLMSILAFVKLNQSAVNDACHAYVQQILSVSQPLAIILFGSMAKGSASIESDIDLLAVYQDVATAKNAQRDVMRLKSPHPTPADLIFADLAYWQQDNRYSPLIEAIRCEGKLLYSSPALKEVST